MRYDDKTFTNSSGTFAVIVVAATLASTACLPGWYSDSTRMALQKPTESKTPTIVLFVVSLSCSHCYEQIESFAEEFTDVPIIVVSPQIDSEIQNRVGRAGIQFVCDVDRKWNQRLNIPDKNGMHATLILDCDGNTLWRHVHPEPLIDVGIVRRQLAQAG